MSTAGTSIVGNSCTPSLVTDSRPKASSAATPINTISGRLIARLVSCTSRSLIGHNWHLGRHNVAIFQVGEATGGDHVAFVHSTQDLGKALILQTNLYVFASGVPAVDRHHAVTLENCFARHEQRSMPCRCHNAQPGKHPRAQL